MKYIYIMISRKWIVDITSITIYHYVVVPLPRDHAWFVSY